MSLTKSPEQRFFDQSFEGRTEELSLFIQASKSTLYFAYFHSGNKQFVGLEEREFSNQYNWHQLSEELLRISKEEGLDAKFKSVSFALIDPLYTLVPSALYEAAKIDSYLELNHSMGEQSGLSCYGYEVTALSTYIVYALPDILKHSLEGIFPKIDFTHHTAPLLEAFALNSKKGNELELHVSRDSFDIIYSKDGKLQLLNTFAYHTAEDFIYYLLYVMEQLEVDRNHIELRISGEIEERSALFETLYKYIRHPQLIYRNDAVNYSQSLNQIPLHKYRNLFNQYLCA